MIPYPKLLWSPTGEEVTVTSPAEDAALVAKKYTPVAPGGRPVLPEPDEEPDREPQAEPAPGPEKRRRK